MKMKEEVERKWVDEGGDGGGGDVWMRVGMVEGEVGK